MSVESLNRACTAYTLHVYSGAGGAWARLTLLFTGEAATSGTRVTPDAQGFTARRNKEKKKSPGFFGSAYGNRDEQLLCPPDVVNHWQK